MSHQWPHKLPVTSVFGHWELHVQSVQQFGSVVAVRADSASSPSNPGLVHALFRAAELFYFDEVE